MDIGRILPGIAILSGQIFVCGGEVDSKILANGEVCSCTVALSYKYITYCTQSLYN